MLPQAKWKELVSKVLSARYKLATKTQDIRPTNIAAVMSVP